MTPEFFKERFEQMLDKTPFAGLSSDLKLALQAQLQGMISSMNLVTREEFDAQLEVLIRCQAQLQELQQRITELEAQQSNSE